MTLQGPHQTFVVHDREGGLSARSMETLNFEKLSSIFGNQILRREGHVFQALSIWRRHFGARHPHGGRVQVVEAVPESELARLHFTMAA